MLGWYIFAYAVLLVLKNVFSAIRVFWAPVFLSFAVFFLCLHLSGLGEAYLSGIGEVFGWGEKIVVPDAAILKFFFPWFFVLIVVNAILTAWGVTAWHRYILLGEFSYGLIPPLNIARIGGYILRAFLLGAITLVLFLPFILVYFGAFEIFAQFGLLFGILAALVAAVVFSMVVFRWSLILPAYAIGNPITLGESWRAWSNIPKPNRAIIGLIIANSVTQSFLGIAIEKLAHMPAYQAIFAISAQVFVFVLNITILTTLYGYVVENRRLS
ncbi:hypothetical protein [Ruegeria atlantica]|uniref:hypothetical protein n=1 Tax=Ruegeria atlantica TaxID=81569 RepID=UPI001480625C|nr:hypothetical protein [Ruegeria atlantica]